MKTKKKEEEIIEGISVNVIELKSIKVMDGLHEIGEYRSLNEIPNPIRHLILEGVYHIHDKKETILV